MIKIGSTNISKVSSSIIENNGWKQCTQLDKKKISLKDIVYNSWGNLESTPTKV